MTPSTSSRDPPSRDAPVPPRWLRTPPGLAAQSLQAYQGSDKYGKAGVLIPATPGSRPSPLP